MGRETFSSRKLLFAAEKLFVDETDFLGDLVVRNCCDYWKGGPGENSNIVKVFSFLRIQIPKISGMWSLYATMALADNWNFKMQQDRIAAT
jgi:hypothetical protein